MLTGRCSGILGSNSKRNLDLQENVASFFRDIQPCSRGFRGMYSLAIQHKNCRQLRETAKNKTQSHEKPPRKRTQWRGSIRNTPWRVAPPIDFSHLRFPFISHSTNHRKSLSVAPGKKSVRSHDWIELLHDNLGFGWSSLGTTSGQQSFQEHSFSIPSLKTLKVTHSAADGDRNIPVAGQAGTATDAHPQKVRQFGRAAAKMSVRSGMRCYCHFLPAHLCDCSALYQDAQRENRRDQSWGRKECEVPCNHKISEKPLCNDNHHHMSFSKFLCFCCFQCPFSVRDGYDKPCRPPFRSKTTIVTHELPIPKNVLPQWSHHILRETCPPRQHGSKINHHPKQIHRSSGCKHKIYMSNRVATNQQQEDAWINRNTFPSACAGTTRHGRHNVWPWIHKTTECKQISKKMHVVEL